MTFLSKEQVLENLLEQKKPICPYCSKEMSIWEVPNFAFGDGLGWGEPYLFVCFNDECSLYVEGWNNIRENYAHNASYRCMSYPGSTSFECIPVFGQQGGKGQIITDQAIAEQNELKEAIKKGFSLLTDLYLAKDWKHILELLLDPLQPVRVQLKAAEMVGDIGSIEAIEPLINNKYSTDMLTNKVQESVAKLHERHFTRECPFCAEIIKKRASVCKHCQRDLTSS
ncbi:MAG: zinc ribbon domain-containing protein [Desulfobacterales bacterium]|nr:zinc ribbon domain-containing protein [Desulfobacterales bacterium]